MPTPRKSRRQSARPISTAVGYVRCSTKEQSSSGLGIEAQLDKISAEADRRGWTLSVVEDRGYSAAKGIKRPGLIEALRRLREVEADCLLVAKADRVSRSMHEFTGIMQTAVAEGWSIVVLDLGIDSTTAAGEMMLHNLMSFSHYEGRMISERTKVALQAAKNRGTVLGRPVTLSDSIARHIVALRASGKSLRAIADELNAKDVPTAQGGSRWFASTVNSVLHRVK